MEVCDFYYLNMNFRTKYMTKKNKLVKKNEISWNEVFEKLDGLNVSANPKEKT